MNNALEMPFEIGQQMWEALYPPTRVRVPCPVCFGQLAVTVVLGDGEHVGVPCEACGIGYDGPRGYIEEWRYEAAARPFVIAGVESMRRDDWVVKNDDGWSINYANLFATEHEALASARAQVESLMERQCDTRRHKRQEVKRALWSVRYHREQIQDLNRKIAWHRSKVESPRSVGAVDPAAPHGTE